MDEVDPLAGDAPVSSVTPTVDDLLGQIEAFGYGTVEYHDCLGFLFVTLARSQWRRADSIRASRRDSEQRRERAAARPPTQYVTCRECGTVQAVLRDGTVRAHKAGLINLRCPGSHEAPVA